MKIALVHSYYSRRQPSGENAVVDAQLDALRRRGHEVRLFAEHTDDYDQDRLYPLRAGFRTITGRGPGPAVSDFEPDIVSVHNLFPNFGTAWLCDVRQPIVATVHNYRSVCANGYLFRNGSVCTQCVDSASSLPALRYGCFRDSKLATIPVAWALRKGATTNPLLTAAKSIVALTERQRSILVRVGVPAEKMEVIPHFLPQGMLPSNDLSNAERFGWVFVGRLSAEKGICELIDKWPSKELLRVIGSGPQQGIAQQRASGKQIDFLGHLPREDVLREIAKSEGLVFPSKWFETFGLTYLEAIACGTPVIAFPPSVVADAVRSEGTGVVMDWSGEIEPRLEEIRRNRGKIQSACNDTFQARYSEGHVVERIEQLFNRVIAQTRA